ncbi:MAG: heme biosynthesis HemY N-terminal domain-containing protein [Pseudomonadales bacterium]
MIKFFILALIITGLVIGLAMLVERDAGYILVAYDNTSIESSLWAGLLALALVLFLLYWLVRLIMKIRYSGRSLRYWREGRQARRNEAQVTQGLIQYMEGNWKASAKTFSRGAERSPTPLLSYLMAARASDAAGDTVQCEEFLKLAETSTPDAQLAIGLTQAELQLNKGEYENCLANLNRIRSEQPENDLALRLSANVYENLEDWAGLQQLLPVLRRKKLLPEEALLKLERKTFEARLTNVEVAAELQTVWTEVPKHLKKDELLVAEYTSALIRFEQNSEAESLLRATLKKDWSSKLIGIYGQVRGDLSKQRSVAEGWLKSRPDDADLLQALGRICAADGALEKAQEYFSSSLAIKPDSDTYGELGQLYAKLGDSEQSNQQYQKALGMDERPVENALPGPSE